MNLHRPVDPEWTLEEENELFEMANLYPEDTGLPMTIWVSPKGNARMMPASRFPELTETA